MKKRTALALIHISLITLWLISVQPAKAAPRTIVVPDDYPTIAAAVGNATDGDTVLVRKGTYDGPRNQTLFINKTISLIGEEASSTILNLHPAYVTQWVFNTYLSSYISSMAINAKDVKLVGFTIIDNGWYVQVNGDNAQVLGNVITKNLKMAGSYQTFAYNTINSTFFPNGTIMQYGAVHLDGNYSRATQNTLTNGGILCSNGHYNSIFGNTGSGLIGTGLTGDSNLVYGNALKNGGGIGIATVGIIVAKNTITNCTRGIGIVWGFNNIVTGNTITDCPGIGLYETDNAGNNTFYANHVANNLEGAKIVAWRSNSTTLYHNNFVNNVRQVNTDKNETVVPYSGPNFTRSLTHGGNFDNGKEGNYWGDYSGTDANNDGFGDTPYVIDANRADHHPLMVPFDISSAALELPSWANLTVPKQLPTPLFPPKPATTETQTLTPKASALSAVILSPQNRTYTETDVPLSFTLSKLVEWMRYSLDGQDNVTVTENTTLTTLSSGTHKLMLHAGNAAGTSEVSETVYFSIAQQTEIQQEPKTQPEPLPLSPTFILASTASITVACAGFLLYFKKRNR